MNDDENYGKNEQKKVILSQTQKYTSRVQIHLFLRLYQMNLNK